MKFTDGLFLDTLPRRRQGIPGDRGVGDARRRALHGARAAARGVRRARAPEPLRRHRRDLRPASSAVSASRPAGTSARTPRCSRRRTARRRSTRPEQGQPDGDDPLRKDHARPSRRGRRGAAARGRGRSRDRRRKSVTYDMKPSRDDPTAVGTARVRGRDHREAGGSQADGRKVTVVGAGSTGATCAEVSRERDYAEIVLIDIKEGLPQGKALDINQWRRSWASRRRSAARTTTAGHGRLRHRRDHGGPAAPAGHEPRGPRPDEREDRQVGDRAGVASTRRTR